MKSSNIEINTNVLGSIDGDILNYEDVRSIYVYIYACLYICPNLLSIILITLVSKHEFDKHQLCYFAGQEKRPGEGSEEKEDIFNDLLEDTGNPLLLAPL